MQQFIENCGKYLIFILRNINNKSKVTIGLNKITSTTKDYITL